MQQLLNHCITTLVQSTQEAIAAPTTHLVEALQTVPDEQLSRAALWWLVDKTTQNVIVVDAKSIERRCLVLMPQRHAVHTIAESSE